MKISVITACYNSVATIRTAMESVWAQRGADVEYIVVDGGSTDGTVDILKEYSAPLYTFYTAKSFVQVAVGTRPWHVRRHQQGHQDGDRGDYRNSQCR